MGGDDGENNDNDGQLQSTESLQALLDQLPQEQICHAFAYGSGVFSQSQRTNRSSNNESNNHTSRTTDLGEENEAAAAPAPPPPPPLVDIIVVVRQAQAFHEANRLRNPSHYYTTWPTSSSAAAAKWATAIQCHDLPWLMSGYVRNPQVYFLLTDDGYKYGVQVNHLIDDLTHWRYLYLAGRLHKPTVTIVHQDNNNNEYDEEDPVTAAQVLTNLPNALVTAFALLQEESSSSTTSTTSATTTPSWRSATATAAASDVDVFTTIASLSYTGDPRMGLGAEDPHKVRSLVHGGHFPQHNIDRWRKLYGPAMRSLEQRGLLSIHQHHHGGSQTVEWDGAGVRRHLPRALLLPSTRGGGGWDNSNNNNKNDPPVHVHHNNNGNGLMIRDQLRSIVAPAARYQSLKGLFTVRPQRAFAYVLRKLAKGRSNNNNNNYNWWWWFRRRGARPF
jgi:Phosphatidate cytidylyltransferase, mitochondrial